MNSIHDAMRSKQARPFTLHLAAAGMATVLVAAPAFAVDWNAVEGKNIVLFAPGQASFEWVMTQTDHSGAQRFREGKNCKSCHDGEQKDIGNLIAKSEGRGARLEPKPILGNPGTIDLNVKTANDGENLSVRLQWKEVKHGGDKLDPNNAARVTMMVSDGTASGSNRTSCWIACHDDNMGMASDKGAKLTKYLFASRNKPTRTGGGEDYKSQAEIDGLFAKGVYNEYWQARLSPGQPAKAVEGWILDKRHEGDAGRVKATSEYQDGTWTVVLTRPLKGGASYLKDLTAGKSYMVGFAVHNNHTDHRFHHVSLEYSLKLDGGDADLVVTKK